MRRLMLLCAGLAATLSAQEIRVVQAASGIGLPTDIQNAGDGMNRLFFVQQNGLIRVYRNGAMLPDAFLDIRSKTHGEDERGLLGLAFPPGFTQKQRFYIDYTDLNGDTVIAQYRVSANPDVADASSEIALLHIAQPFANHNGGQVRFGPDGYLYIAMGDGGSGGDPLNNGQSLSTLLGKLLRVDVESEPGKVHIPADNPFVSQAGARPEIWAYGLRNPWRFSFDRATKDLWIADVGQDSYEEVDFQPAASHGGENYGWNRMEGLHCFQARCSMDGLTLPIAEYTHDPECSITGGFMYHGRVSPGLRGIYLYGDYCSGKIWGIERQGANFVSRLLLSSGFLITTFGEDEAGEIYVASQGNGSIYHIVGSAAPRLNAGGVVNSASYAPGLVPGSIATAFAAGVLDDPGVVAGANGLTVTVNGISAPVLGVANVNGQEQVNFQAPYEIAGKTSAPVAITRAGQASASVDVPVASLQPGVYVITHGDYTAVTVARPLQRGEIAILWASGLGAVSNQPPTGGVAPSSALVQANVRVTLGGIPCDVAFAGLGPGLIGVYQVNFRVASNVASGSQQLILAAGNVAAPAAPAIVQ
ncbi:MAG: hypothetical protein C5B51_26595 [Terriglobia bacterium]|nr:MAG: hypothetical protein C5B51_26595 [Terriglobia bacterium]